jgi:mannose-6-phosphate isomerase-like protein (cupin superfamily)
MGQPTAYAFPNTYVHLADDGGAIPLALTDSFWPDLMSGKLELGPGRLVSFFEFDADWDSWEAHPAGEEVVCLISGAMDLVLELPQGNETVELREPGAFLLVPRGTWHTARVREPSRAMFITAGEGTEHRPA